MPLVFGTGAPTASGHAYEDVFGVQYEFPDQYRTYVTRGERFLYYRGARAGGGAVYLGGGIVGAVRPSKNIGNHVAVVHDVTAFGTPLSLRTPDGTYWETGSTTGTNWANGVRRISDKVFDRILSAGSGTDISPSIQTGFYADPSHALKVERYSIGVVAQLLADEFGADAVREMPPGNPGFDIEVSTALAPLHVEVKGTTSADPVFHLSEGQRRHAELLGDTFRIFVVYAIHLRGSQHRVAAVQGPLTEDKATLLPATWAGRLLG